MDSITFQATIQDDQVIRPPTGVRLPQGTLQVTVTPVVSSRALASVAAANALLRKCRVSLRQATGTDNQAIDADLARVYGNE